MTRREQVPDLTPRLAELERKVRAIELDWDETYDKFRRLYARLSKRVEREASENGAGSAQDKRSPAERTTNPLALAILQGGKHGLLRDG